MKVSAMCGAVLCQLALVAPAAAEITRHCKAQWEVRHSPSPIVRSFGQFEAHGACPNRVWANDCRRRARGYAQECFREAWQRRGDPAILSGAQKPGACLRRGAIRVSHYGVRDVKLLVERSACAMQVARPTRVHVVGRTWGDKRCSGEIVLSQTYTVTDEMCGKI